MSPFIAAHKPVSKTCSRKAVSMAHEHKDMSHRTCSCKMFYEPRYDLAMHVGEAEVAALEAVG